MQIRSITDLYNIIQKIDFVPLFSNAVPGFSVEEHTLLSARTHNCLTRAGLRTMGDVAKLLYSKSSYPFHHNIR